MEPHPVSLPPEILLRIVSWVSARDLQSLWGTSRLFQESIRCLKVLRVNSDCAFSGSVILDRMKKIRKIEGVVRVLYADLEALVWTIPCVLNLHVTECPRVFIGGDGMAYSTPPEQYCRGPWFHVRHLRHFRPEINPLPDNKEQPLRILCNLEEPKRGLRRIRPSVQGALDYNAYNAYGLFRRVYKDLPHMLFSNGQS